MSNPHIPIPRQADFAEWSERLQVFGIDLRDLAAIETFCSHLCSRLHRLDAIVNNACQTIRRPARFYQHLISRELAPQVDQPETIVRLLASSHDCFGPASANIALTTTAKELAIGEAGVPMASAPTLAAAEAAAAAAAAAAPPPPAVAGACTKALPPASQQEVEGARDRQTACPPPTPPPAAATAVPIVPTPILPVAAASATEQLGIQAAGLSSADGVPSALLSQLPLWGGNTAVSEPDGGRAEDFPLGSVDVNGQQIDARQSNSWLLRMHEVSTPEAAEVLAINALAPFIINSRLDGLLRASPEKYKFVVNVSAMEGKFYRYKTPNHPHTNMAKAALNMMTRTCADDLAKVGILMNSVDTGWINDENPLERARATADRHHFQTPLDEVDAAARVVDPILHVASGGDPLHGKFLKDYLPCEW